MRKAALASALTLLLTLNATPVLLNSALVGSSSHDTGLGYAPTATDFIYPVGNPRIAPTYDQGNANGYAITQMFNNSCDPSLNQGFYYAGHYFCGHTGVDLSDLSMGGTVRAVANGVVVYSGYNSSYGEMIRIQHTLSDGSYVYSQYEHLEYGSRLVSYGEVVVMGQQIGLVGNTGFVTGAHLHFEMKSVNEDGVGYTFGNDAFIVGYYDPISWIAAHTQQLIQPSPTPAPATDTPTFEPITQAVTASATLTATAATADSTPISGSTPISDSTTASSGGEQTGLLADFYKRYQSYVVVTADHLNVRAGSGYDFTPMNSVSKGARLGYLGMSGNGWVHVALPSDVYGFVAREWVKGRTLPKLPPVQFNGKLKPPFATVLDTRYPARVGPMMHDAAIEPLRGGEKVTYMGTLGSWDKVVLPSGRIGWVLNWYLREPRIHWSLAQPASAGNTTAAGSVAAKTRTSTSRRAAIAGPYVVTTVDGLRLRAGPRLAAPVIEGLSKGTKLGLRGYHTSWVAVQAPDGTHGYVLGTYVKVLGTAASNQRAAEASHPPVAGTTTAVTSTAALTSSATDAAPPSSASGPSPRVSHAAAGFQAPYLVVTVPMTTGANLRAGPSLKARILVSEPHGALLALRGTRGDWAYVETKDGLTGWIMRDLTASTARA